LGNDPIFYQEQIPESLLTILKRLADGGFLKNNRQWIVGVGWTRDPWLFQVIRSMNNLEKLNLLKCKLTLTDVPQLFRSCPKLTELHLRLFDRQNLEMGEELKNVLRPGFQRISLFELVWEIDSWPVLQEMFT
jgi:hypothetical protein